MKKFEGMMLACDMDGTLLDSSRRISRKNQQALRYFTEEGGRFTLATGRAPHAIEAYIPQLPFNAPYSLLNGSLILDEKHHVLHCAGMPESTKELIQLTLTEFSQLAFFYHHQLLPAGFTAKSCTTRLFCTSYHLIKLL